jgi:hypothetical protein
LRRVAQVFITFVLLMSVTFADEFRDIKKISLKKDEQKKILVKYGSYERLFKFRWTLYSNGGLVIFRSYDRNVGQNILYLGNKNSSFRVNLKAKGADYFNVPYMLVKFKEFDYETNEAKFELLISDKQAQIEMQELKK